MKQEKKAAQATEEEILEQEAAGASQEETDEAAPEMIEKEKYDELYDKHLRALAEFDNFKKRTQKEKDELYSFAVVDVMKNILPVLDNLERAANAAEEASPYADGVKMVLKQFGETLEKMDICPIEAVGKEFDPNLHNAVMHEENDEVGANIIVEEFQKGYKYKERVIRYSMVKVAN